jgi:hypothetical protein
MFNKNDPLIGAVTKIMEQNETHRQVERKLCEELGIFSRDALPHEHRANYDALLEQRLSEAGKVLPDLTQKKMEVKPSKEYAQRMNADKDKKKSSENERARAAGLFKGTKKSMKEALHPIDEVSKKTAIKTYIKRQSRADDFYSDTKDQEKANKTLSRIDKKFGSKTTKDAERGVEIDKKGRKGQVGGFDYLDIKQDVYSNFSKPDSKKGSKQRLDYMKLNKGRFVKEDTEQLDEAAKSKAQQRIMGMALAMRRGESDRGSREVARIATDMPEKELEKFAKTKHKGLPEKKNKIDESKKDDDSSTILRAIVAKHKLKDIKKSGVYKRPELLDKLKKRVEAGKNIKESEFSLDDVMEEIARNLGEEKMKKIEEQEPSQPASTVATSADRDAFRARTGSTVNSTTGQTQASQPASTVATSADRDAFRARTGSTVGAQTTRSAADDRDNAEKAAQATQRQAPTPASTPEAPKPKFGAAFAAARKAGQTEFEFGGKKFNTSQRGETRAQTQSALARNRAQSSSVPTPPPRPAAATPGSPPRPSSAPTSNVPMPPRRPSSGQQARGGMMAESLENTIRNIIKD